MLLHRKPEKCLLLYFLFLELPNNFVTFLKIKLSVWEVKLKGMSRLISFPPILPLIQWLYPWFNAELSIGYLFTYFVCWVIQSRSHRRVEILYFGSSTCCFVERTHASPNTMYNCEVVSGIWPPYSRNLPYTTKPVIIMGQSQILK